MPQTLTYPGVYVEEVSSGVRTISGVATSIALFIGWAKQGPVDEARRIHNFADFERLYGGLDGRAPLGYSVKHFFDNGGSDAYVIRLATVGEADEDAKTASVTVKGIGFEATSPGEWANSYKVKVTPRAGADSTRFKVTVLLGSSPVETFENLSIDSTDERYVQSFLKDRSRIVKVTGVPGTAPNGEQELALEDGDDGDVIKPNGSNTDFEDAVIAAFGSGKAADLIDLFNLVCVPGFTKPDKVGELAQKCAAKRAFLIVDSVPGQSIEDAAKAPAAMNSSGSTYAGLYYPWVLARDPLMKGAITAYPPCGFVAGIFARTDAQRGVWKAPAGTDAVINGAIGPEIPLTDLQNGDLNIKGVNCLRTFPTYGNVVWGARTLDGDNDRASEWKYVPVRRMALFLEESLFRGTKWVVFEPNDEPLWSQIRLNVGAFMQSLFRQGAFQGVTPREAYFVKCDRTTTTQDDINQGIVNIHVGFAPLKPAEFVVLRIQQIAGEIAT